MEDQTPHGRYPDQPSTCVLTLWIQNPMQALPQISPVAIPSTLWEWQIIWTRTSWLFIFLGLCNCHQTRGIVYTSTRLASVRQDYLQLYLVSSVRIQPGSLL